MGSLEAALSRSDLPKFPRSPLDECLGEVQREPEVMTRRAKTSAAQLDREIAEVLSRGKAQHSTQLASWWLKAAPEEDKVCYDTKTKALKAFLDTNYEIIQNYGGADYAVSPSEFDAINHKYGLHGKRAARTIAQAVWAAMPEGKPFCLDRID